MLVRSGDLWHCTNPACLSELSIGTSRDTDVDHVYCVCGAVMKKHCHPPAFRYLNCIGEREQDALHALALTGGECLAFGTAQRERQEPGEHYGKRLNQSAGEQSRSRNRREIALFQYALVMQLVSRDHERQRSHADFFTAGHAATRPSRLI